MKINLLWKEVVRLDENDSLVIGYACCRLDFQGETNDLLIESHQDRHIVRTFQQENIIVL